MSTVTIGVSSIEETKSRMLRAFEGEQQGAFIGFPSVELLWAVLTPKRWALLRALTGVGPVSIREAARRVGRDVKSVHGDVQGLLASGVLDRTDDGRIEFPYESVHVDLMV